MKNYYKERYALSEQGAKNVVTATVFCFLMYVLNMLPMFLLMLLSEQLLLHHVGSIWKNISLSIGIVVSMYLVLSKEYISLYDATFKESANLREEIATSLSKLPLAYFSKHDLTDLSQAIMSDVERVEHAISHTIPKVFALWIFFPLMGVLMLCGNWKLGLAVILPTLFSFIFLPLAKKGREASYKQYYDVLRENSDVFQETIELQQEISSFNQSEKESGTYITKWNRVKMFILRWNSAPCWSSGYPPSFLISVLQW